MKICSKCGQNKELSEFYKDLQKSDNLSSSCKDCKREDYKKAKQQGKIKYKYVKGLKPRKRSKVAGVGINDADYAIIRRENKKVVYECPFFKRWHSMLVRVFKSNKSRPTYEGVTCCNEWLTFSNFKAWMEKQDWEGLELDKDLLSKPGLKIYSPETCCFIPQYLNIVIAVDRRNSLYGPGVHKRGRKYVAILTDNGVMTNLGSYNTYFEARTSYNSAKSAQIKTRLDRYRKEKFYNQKVENGLLSIIYNLENEIE